MPPIVKTTKDITTAQLKKEAGQLVAKMNTLRSHMARMHKEYSTLEDEVVAFERKLVKAMDEHGIKEEEIYAKPDALNEHFDLDL